MSRVVEVTDWQRRPEIKKLVSAAFPSYRRKTVKVVPTTDITLQQLNWDGGTRNEYKFVWLDGAVVCCWDDYGEGKTVSVPEGRAVVQGGTFCGKSALCYIYVNLKDVTKLLPDHKGENPPHGEGGPGPFQYLSMND